MEPITREEKYLAAMTGANITPPAPVTRHEMYLAAILNKLSEGATGGGTASEWSDLGESVTNLGETLTWDGNTEGKVTDNFGIYVKISDNVPTKEDAASGWTETVTNVESGEVQTMSTSGEEVAVLFNESGAALGIAIAIIPSANMEYEGMVWPEAGTYAISSPVGYVSSFTIPGYNFTESTIKPVPEKYLPTPDWNANEGESGYIANRPFYEDKTERAIYTETVFTPTDGKVELDTTLLKLDESDYRIIFDGVEYNFYDCVTEAGEVYLGNLALINMGEDTGEPVAMGYIPSWNMAVLAFSDSNSHTVSITGIKVERKKLDTVFIDTDWIAHKNTQYDEIIEETTVTLTSRERYEVSASGKNSDILSYGTVKVIWNGVEYICAPLTMGENTALFGNMYAMVESNQDDGKPFCFQVDADSVDVFAVESGEATFSIYGIRKEPVAMPEEYLPESVDYVILRSSTADSTKKFKVTVDDSGNLTATEVT